MTSRLEVSRHQFSANAGGDDDMKELFAAFDHAPASEASVERFLAALDEAEEEQESVQANVLHAFRAPVRRGRFVRIMAVAACAAALVIGGAAYAMPASSIVVSTAGGTVELGVNCFGLTVSATSDNDEAQRVLEQSHVRNMPYDRSLGIVIDSLGAPSEGDHSGDAALGSFAPSDAACNQVVDYDENGTPRSVTAPPAGAPLSPDSSAWQPGLSYGPVEHADGQGGGQSPDDSVSSAQPDANSTTGAADDGRGDAAQSGQPGQPSLDAQPGQPGDSAQPAGAEPTGQASPSEQPGQGQAPQQSTSAQDAMSGQRASAAWAAPAPGAGGQPVSVTVNAADGRTRDEMRARTAEVVKEHQI